MPKIFEVFGYPLKDKSAKAAACRCSATCPFMGVPCDGGGNRYLSNLKFKEGSELQNFFSVKDAVPAGVCSIQIQDTSWIVCPRRLLVLGKEQINKIRYQDEVHNLLISKANYPKGTLLGVWTEVKIKHTEKIGTIIKSFDYTFDYIVAPLKRTNKDQVQIATGTPWEKIKGNLARNGYTTSLINNELCIDNFPCGPPTIIEIMTSSTSGGNKSKRTTIPNAFEDAILGKEHTAPGINYRQVWARMASQLIVKSEIGKEWGGATIWVLQDALVDYISNSTALDIRNFLAKNISDVNILSFSYGSKMNASKGVIELHEGKLYAGPLRPIVKTEESFQDIIRIPCSPPVEILWKHLVEKKPVNFIKL